MNEQTASSIPSRRAALYIRSTGFYNIADSDLESLRSYAEQHGYQIVATYRDEGKSARSPHPDELAHLCADAAQNLFDVVLVAHHTRLGRTQVEAQAVIEEIERHGVAVESLAGDIPLASS